MTAVDAVSTGVSWNAGRYGQNLAHHRSHDAEFLAPLGFRGDEQVLDLGCGVGDLSAAIAAGLRAGTVTGVDADPGMVARAGERQAPNLRFVRVPAQRVADAFAPGGFDVVVSVAVLHWVPEADQATVAAAVHRILRTGGRFRADFGGSGQIAATRRALDEVAVAHGGRPAGWYFPTAEAYAAVLAEAGFSTSDGGWVRRIEQRRPFPDVAAIRGWLSSQVSIAYLPHVPEPAREPFLAAVDDVVVPNLRRSDGSYDQDYVRIDVLATAA